MQTLMTVDELAEQLGVKKSTIYQWTHLRFVPHVKLGSCVRFREEEILKWLEEKSVRGRMGRRRQLGQ
jgi:excisionase family DNA binding protein